MRKGCLRQQLHGKLKDYMKSVFKWDDNLEKELPSSWENFNGFLIFTSPSFKSTAWAQPEVWEMICSCLKGHSIALKGRIANDGFRSPQARLLYGNTPIVYYLDNGVKYSWHVEKNMFSAGNVRERHRIAALDCTDEVIVDLFAGIGYFTLPYLIHANAKFVHACEWNPDAIESLRRNLYLNKVEGKCEIHEGDNRQVCPKNVANRVNLGLIPNSEPFWSIACEALLESGGKLYIHNNVTSELAALGECSTCKDLITNLNINFTKNMLVQPLSLSKHTQLNFHYSFSGTDLKWKHPEWFVFSLHISHVLLENFKRLYSKSWTVSVNDVFRVKSYAPHIDHLVYTVHCRPL